MPQLAQPYLVQLIMSVRGMLNQPDAQNSFWTDIELTRYLNDAIAVYFLEVVQSNEGYFVTTTPLDITVNVETVPLPSDFFQVKGLYKKVVNGFELLPYKNNLLNSYSTQGGTSSATYIPWYDFQGNNLLLRPIPNFSETGGLKLDYIQFPTTLLDGGDQMTAQVSPIFKQVIEMYAVYKAKVKESLVTNVNVHANAEAMLQQLLKQFRDAVQQRSKNPSFVVPFNPEFGGF